MFAAGGNAVDAAVAAGWALSVCEPSGSGLGGQAVVLIYLPTGQFEVVDGHAYAPAAVSRTLVTRGQQSKGFRAGTIPSMPAALSAAHASHGTLRPSSVIEPAIRLAHEGYPISRLQRRQQKWCLASLRANKAARRLFLRKGKPYRIGATFRQPKLAATLERLAQEGIDDFYRGQLAEAIAADMEANDGLLTREDLASFSLRPSGSVLRIDYRAFEVVTVPPPAGGVEILLALRLLECLLPTGRPTEAEWARAIAEVVPAVHRARDEWPVHPDRMTPSLANWLVGRERAAEIAASLDRRPPGHRDGPASPTGGETTHVCTADPTGMVVSLTQSIQSVFGAKVANAELGFLYNNYLSTCPRSGHPYQLASGCIPRSNAAPTIVRRRAPGLEATPFLATGAAGSRRITSSVLQVVSGMIDLGRTCEDAVNAPRIHGQLSGPVHIEPGAADAALEAHLAGRFRGVHHRARHSFFMGSAQAIARTDDGLWVGAADARRGGAAGVQP